MSFVSFSWQLEKGHYLVLNDIQVRLDADLTLFLDHQFCAYNLPGHGHHKNVNIPFPLVP